jgi:hypothetical protein
MDATPLPPAETRLVTQVAAALQESYQVGFYAQDARRVAPLYARQGGQEAATER